MRNAQCNASHAKGVDCTAVWAHEGTKKQSSAVGNDLFDHQTHLFKLSDTTRGAGGKGSQFTVTKT